MFKCFQFIDEMMRQLNEADEMPMEDDSTEMGNDEQMGNEEQTPDESGDMGSDDNSTSDPSKIAEVDNGTFVSDLGNAEMAKTLLKALTVAKPNEQIPAEFQTVTTDNADIVIRYVKNMLSLNGNEGFDGMSDEEIMNMPV
jgi:hypothetical protein